MSYECRLGDMLLPVAPSKLDIKVNGNNKTVNLINDGEINILKKVGLFDISFEFLLPNVEYSFARYEGSEKGSNFKDSAYFIKIINDMRTTLKPYKFTIIRVMPNGVILFDTDLDVSIEDYTLKEDSNNGFDIIVSIKLKSYRAYKTKIIEDNIITEKRNSDYSPAPKSAPKNYTVIKGDTLWAIAKREYGDGNLYTKLASSNNITNPNKISVGQVIKIPV